MVKFQKDLDDNINIDIFGQFSQKKYFTGVIGADKSQKENILGIKYLPFALD